MGIICVTPDNVKKPWLFFEAGAIGMRFGIESGTRVVPYVLGMKVTDLGLPLSNFQATAADQGTLALVQAINEVAPTPVVDLDAAFDMWWPRLDPELSAARDAIGTSAPHRSDGRRLTRSLPTSGRRGDGDHRREQQASASEQAMRDFIVSPVGTRYPSMPNQSALIRTLFDTGRFVREENVDPNFGRSCRQRAVLEIRRTSPGLAPWSQRGEIPCESRTDREYPLRGTLIAAMKHRHLTITSTRCHDGWSTWRPGISVIAPPRYQVFVAGPPAVHDASGGARGRRTPGSDLPSREPGCTWPAAARDYWRCRPPPADGRVRREDDAPGISGAASRAGGRWLGASGDCPHPPWASNVLRLSMHRGRWRGGRPPTHYRCVPAAPRSAPGLRTGTQCRRPSMACVAARRRGRRGCAAQPSP